MLLLSLSCQRALSSVNRLGFEERGALRDNSPESLLRAAGRRIIRSIDRSARWFHNTKATAWLDLHPLLLVVAFLFKKAQVCDVFSPPHPVS